MARLHCQNLLAVAMPSSCELSPELQPTVSTSPTHCHQRVRHDEAKAPVEREADSRDIVDQATFVGASLLCSGVERSSALLSPLEQASDVKAVTAQVHPGAVSPRLEALWFSIEIEVRTFPVARVNLELRDVALRLPALPA